MTKKLPANPDIGDELDGITLLVVFRRLTEILQVVKAVILHKDTVVGGYIIRIGPAERFRVNF